MMRLLTAVSLLSVAFSSMAFDWDIGAGLGYSAKTFKYNLTISTFYTNEDTTVNSALFQVNAEALFHPARVFGVGVGALFNYMPHRFKSTETVITTLINTYESPTDITPFLRLVWFLRSNANVFFLVGPSWQYYRFNYDSHVNRDHEFGGMFGLGSEIRLGEHNQYGLRMTYFYSLLNTVHSHFTGDTGEARATFEPYANQVVLGFNYYF